VQYVHATIASFSSNNTRNHVSSEHFPIFTCNTYTLLSQIPSSLPTHSTQYIRTSRDQIPRLPPVFDTTKDLISDAISTLIVTETCSQQFFRQATQSPPRSHTSQTYRDTSQQQQRESYLRRTFHVSFPVFSSIRCNRSHTFPYRHTQTIRLLDKSLSALTLVNKYLRRNFHVSFPVFSSYRCNRSHSFFRIDTHRQYVCSIDHFGSYTRKHVSAMQYPRIVTVVTIEVKTVPRKLELCYQCNRYSQSLTPHRE